MLQPVVDREVIDLAKQVVINVLDAEIIKPLLLFCRDELIGWLIQIDDARWRKVEDVADLILPDES